MVGSRRPVRLSNSMVMLREMNEDDAYSAPPAAPTAPSVTAPVALVTMEIRHPATDSLTESTSRELKHLLADSLPIERQAQDMSWGMVAPGAAPTPTADRFVRFVNRDNTTGRLDEEPGDRHRDHRLHQLRGVPRRCDAGRGRSRAGLVDRRGGAHRPALCPRDPGSHRAWMAASSGATGSRSRCSGRSASPRPACS